MPQGAQRSRIRRVSSGFSTNGTLAPPHASTLVMLIVSACNNSHHRGLGLQHIRTSAEACASNLSRTDAHERVCEHGLGCVRSCPRACASVSSDVHTFVLRHDILDRPTRNEPRKGVTISKVRYVCTSALERDFGLLHTELSPNLFAASMSS